MSEIAKITNIAIANVNKIAGKTSVKLGGVDWNASTFQPTDITEIQRWYKADAIVGLNDGDAIDTWPDSSGSSSLGRDLGHEGGDTTRPLYKTNIQGGKPAVLFDGSNDYMIQNTGQNGTSYSSNKSIVLVSKYSPASWSSYAGAAGFFNCNAFMGYPGNNTSWYPLNTIYRDGVSSNDPKLGEWHVFIMTDITGAYNPDFVMVGRAKEASRYWDGYIAEVLVYSKNLSSQERTNLTNYFKTKYSIA